MLARITIALACLAAVAANDCATAPYGNCGSDAAGVSCCPTGQYCQPWDSAYYQCIDVPAKCTEQYPDVDFNGDDLETVFGIQPGECCTRCTEISGCVAYTFVNSNPGQQACYLKSGTGTKTTSIGAVSGIVTTNTNSTTPTPTPTPTASSTSSPTSAPTPTATSTPTPTPTSSCATAAYGSCGSSTGTTCCPSSYYCQPWSDSYYQCIPPPSQCSSQLTDTDYPGDDLETVYVSLPSLCCDACASKVGCKAYTYINNNPGQPVCYLKSAAGIASTKVGAVSGILN